MPRSDDVCVFAPKPNPHLQLAQDIEAPAGRSPTSTPARHCAAFEERDTKLQFLGFLSRYEETQERKAKAETYRLVTTTEDEFLRFVKLWAKWVSQFKGDNLLSEAA